MTVSAPFSCISEGEKLWPDDYISGEAGSLLTQEHCRDVLQGSYDIPYFPERPPTILDLGANIGAFARWACQRWPGAIIDCYEPEPHNFSLLQQTVTLYCQKAGSIRCHQEAVAQVRSRQKLKSGKFNCGEYSLYYAPNPDQKTCIVDVIAGSELPVTDILKIDCEGAEGLILASLHEAEKLGEFKAIMLEYHAFQHGQFIKRDLEALGYQTIGHKSYNLHRGEMKFMKPEFISK